MKKHNIFITIEGGEGSGKSTVANLVAKRLSSEGQEVFLTREPGGVELPFSESIRDIIMSFPDIDPITELFLFNASRREHMVKKILPALKEGKLVISDRFTDSTIVYQGFCKGVPRSYIDASNDITIQNEIPKLVFIFDIDPIISQNRITLNNRDTNRFDWEDKEFHKKVREGYRELAKENDRYILVDATKSPEEITELIIKKIKEYDN